MASDAALVLRLETRLNKFERDLNKAVSTADTKAKEIENRFNRSNPTVKVRIREVGGTGGALGGTGLSSGGNAAATQRLSGAAQQIGGAAVGGLLRGGLAGIAAGISVDAISEYADAWTSATNKLRAAGLTATEVAIAQERLTGIASRSRTDFSAVADLYGKLSLSAEALGANQQQVAIATETVSKAMKLGGASASETASAVLQLGQALSSGTLQGDELRSLLENAPQLARVIAKEFGVSVGQLRDLGSQGKLTANQVFTAIVKAQGDVDRAFKQSGRTLSDTYTELKNSAISYVGSIMEAVRASASHVEAMEQERSKAEELRRERGLATQQAQADPAAGVQSRAAREVEQSAQSLDYFKKQLGETIDAIKQFGIADMDADVKAALIEKLTQALNGDADAATKARVELEALAKTNPVSADLIRSFDGLLQALGAVRREASLTASALSSISGGDPGLRRGYDTKDLPPPKMFSGAAKAADARDQAEAEATAEAVLKENLVKSKLDEKAKRIQQAGDDLKKQLQGKGLPVPGNLNSVASQIVANQDAVSGAGSGGGGTTTDEYDRAVQGIQKRTAALEVELATMGRSTFEVEKAKAAHDLLNAAKQADREITPALTAAIDQQAEAYARTSEKVKQAGEAQNSMNELARFAGQSISSFFSDIVSGGENAGKALMNLTKRLADAALQAALLGEGPLASLFGTKGSSGAVGGLIGMLFSGFGTRASGGSVSANKPYIVGEAGPELMIPGKSGMVIPNNALSSVSGAGGTSVTVNQTFANPVAPLTQQDLLEWSKVTKEAAMAGTFDAIRRGRG